jgi:hypothetical protein
VGEVPLYKYLTPHWAKKMMRLGSMLIGTLDYYRAQEAKDPERGDAGEGTRQIHGGIGPRTYSNQAELPVFARASIVLEPGAKITMEGPYEMAEYVSIPDLYVYCLTEAFDPDVMRRFGGACVRIDNHRGFFNIVAKTLALAGKHGVSPVRNGLLSRCVYGTRDQMHDQVHKNHPCFDKPRRYQHQAEVRAAWEPTSSPITPLPITCPDVVRYCTRLR